jgi:2,3-diketo-5-methylthio-1-phosphopentane phosphatase
MRQPIALLCDFDGTISRQDVGDLVLDNLVFPQIDAALLEALGAEDPGSKHLYTQWYTLAPPSQQDFQQTIMQAEIGPDFQALYELAKRQGDAVAIVSDGFDAYIRPLLARANISGIPAYSNVMGFGTSFKLDFPHHNPDCRFCGVCKAAIALYYINRGFYTVYIGDGTSDRFPVHIAHQVFAKDALVDICEEEGIRYQPFSSFQDVVLWYTAGELSENQPRNLHPKCSSLTGHSLGFLDHRRAANLLAGSL